MDADLRSLRIDRSRPSDTRPRWAVRWIVAGIALFVLLVAGRLLWSRLNSAVEVEVVRVVPSESGGGGPRIVLNATGYIVAAHKIELASKVMGRVAWIGVDKGDKVKAGQVIVRLEDDEYRAQLQQARGQLAALEARLQELLRGSRPEEIAMAKANLEQAQAELENARVSLERTRKLVAEKVLSQQALDDAQARYEAQKARVASLERNYELVRIGPRQEQIDAVRGQVEQARGAVAFYETQLANTLIRAPISGTILEREVEPGEFVTTSFVGERGAKGYVVSLADLNDLEVELDISQNDFAKLRPKQKGIVTTDAYPDRKYEGVISQISPEANRQKATVQVKVKILNPDEYLRPEMNASVAFYSDEERHDAAAPRPTIVVPTSAVRDGGVFVALGGRAVRRPVRTGPPTGQGIRIEDGLLGGEDLIVNPPAELKDGDRIRIRKGHAS
ncbi:MAG: efflux RND transporter periplasmic adaptor subunit [Bryobacterales bacterium]|nr:efflux RND transporter periplasmic adaptor subunit [Bryobacteraceae bacterium]MDW8354251.1 efflux RND transporter periplasmic adaptor subunit [Bryobacterales bacterium]